MKKSALALLLVGTLGLAACGRSGNSAAALKALDADNDGTISVAEARAGGSKIFAKLNSDNDGTLDAKELAGRLDEASIKAADPDHDGTLDAKEYEAVGAEKFKATDPDNDGTVDKNELIHQPARSF